MKGVCFLGGYVEGYPRSEVLRKGLIALGVPVRSCRAPHKKKLFARYATLIAKYTRMERDFDVIFVPEFRHKDVPLAAFLASITGKLCVFDPLVSRYDTKIKDRGDARDRTFQSWHNRNIDRVSMRLPDLLLADTAAHAEYYKKEFLPPGHRVEVLPVGYDEKLFAVNGYPASTSHEGVCTVLFYGSYLPLHGVDTIVSAAERLKDDAAIRFELIGGGQTYGEVREYVERRGLSNVRLFPRVPMVELPGRIASASLCLGIFGKTEKAGRVVPNKVYQCMGMGKAVITERSPAMQEAFADGEDVVLVPPSDPEALAAAVRNLSRDRDKRASLGENALRKVAGSYTSRDVAETFVDYCVSVKREKRQ